MEDFDPHSTEIPVVFIKGGRVVTNSRDIAAFVGKEHRHVVRDIDQILSHRPDLGSGWFEEVIEPHPVIAGRDFRSFDLSRDGAVLLISGYTGRNALEFKIKYIIRFNEMEAMLERPRRLAPEAAGGSGDGPPMVRSYRPFGYDIPAPMNFRIAGGGEMSFEQIEAGLAIHREWRRAIRDPRLMAMWHLCGLPVPDLPPPAVPAGGRHAGLECLLHLLGSECGEGNPLVQSVMVAALVGDSEAADLLGEHGMRVVDGGIAVSNTHPFILAVFDSTAWRGGGHVGALRELPGACAPKTTYRFGREGRKGGSARATLLSARLVEEPVLAA